MCIIKYLTVYGYEKNRVNIPEIETTIKTYPKRATLRSYPTQTMRYYGESSDVSNHEFAFLLSDCSSYEMHLLLDTVRAAKKSMWGNQWLIVNRYR